MESLCKLYLELSQVVPGSCKSERELKLEEEIQKLKNDAYNKAKAEFSAVVGAQHTILNLVKWLAKDKSDEFGRSYGEYGLELLEKALMETSR